MILYVNGSVNLPVFDCDKGKYFGRITHILLDDNLKQVTGYVCRTRIFRPRWAFETASVRLVNKDLMLIDRKGKKWLPLNKVVQEAWRKSKTQPKVKVFEGEKAIGEVADFAFESDSGRVVGILVSRGLLGKLVYVPATSILMTGNEGILVEEGSIKVQEPPSGKSLVNGLLRATARGLGSGVARARVAAKQRAAGSLVGKAAPADIKDSAGRVLVEEGESLTPEVIKDLEEADKLSEASLVMMGKNFGAALAKASKHLKKKG